MRSSDPRKIEMLFRKEVSNNNQQQTNEMAYVANYRMNELEKDNESINKDNKELRAILAVQEGQIERNTSVLKQLIYGLFHQGNQKGMIKHHMNRLLGVVEKETIDEESIWPTTRQADKHEDRLTALEEKLEKREEEMAVLEENLAHIFRERDEQLTEIELRLGDMEMKINAMEKQQLERLGM